MKRRLLSAASIAATMICSVAVAEPGVTTGNVNMRTGPGTGYPVITTIPAGSSVDVIDCQGWCAVSYSGTEGYVSGNYVQTQFASRVEPRGYVVEPRVYAYRPVMPDRAYWRYGRPWWDDRYSAWYDGQNWWHEGRWYSQPSFSIGFRFGDLDVGDRDRHRDRRDGYIGDGDFGNRDRCLLPDGDGCY